VPTFTIILKHYMCKLLIVFGGLVLAHLVLDAQVTNVDYEKRFNPDKKSPENEPVARSLEESRFHVKKTNLFGGLLSLKKNSILNQRYHLDMSPQYQERLRDLTSQKLSYLTRDPEDESANISTQKQVNSIEKRLSFGMSSAYLQERVWTAHLQKADFEMIADQLSLNDINRYTFRKNRKASGETIPVQSVVTDGNLKKE
jgi:hypothetical protein